MRLAWREGERVPARLKLRVLPDTPRARRSFFTLKLANLAKRFQKFPKCAIVCQWFVNFLPNINKIPSNVAEIFMKFANTSWNFEKNYENFSKMINKLPKICKILNFRVSSGAKMRISCRARKTLQNEQLVAKIGVDTDENEPSEIG